MFLKGEIIYWKQRMKGYKALRGAKALVLRGEGKYVHVIWLDGLSERQENGKYLKTLFIRTEHCSYCRTPIAPYHRWQFSIKEKHVCKLCHDVYEGGYIDGKRYILALILSYIRRIK